MIPPFRKGKMPERVLQDLQDAVSAVLDPLVRLVALIHGRLIANVALSTTPVNVEHKLDRPLVGWIVVRKNADARIWEDQATTVDGSKFLRLDASAAVTVTLWVF